MAFLSGLFRMAPSNELPAEADGIVSRMTVASPPSPDVVAFRSALEVAHAAPALRIDGAVQGALAEALAGTTALLDEKQFVRAMTQALDVMSRFPSVSASCLNVIGSAYARLYFFRDAIAHHASALRFEPFFKTAQKNLSELNQALYPGVASPLAPLVLAAMSTQAFDGVIAQSTEPKEVIGALLARGETARRLGAPQLALHDFVRAWRLEARDATKALIVLAAADLSDAEAQPLVETARQTAGFVELDARLGSVLPQWEAAAREEWSPVLEKLGTSP